ncbi:MAG TPA: pyridoxamine 5'-phosphate oxidase family protein [Deltaproteobacteria bacterium]|nr:pyridoxamine 5'-phosphate oxidase family protein [Deltaproteobacteria bacterium]
MKERLETLLRELFSSQRLAVLATCAEDKAHGSLVAFAATRDLKAMVFATMRKTRKFANLSQNPDAALVIDSRTNTVEDFTRALAVTANGRTREVPDEDLREALDLYLTRHPTLAGFVTSPGCALVRLDVESYRIVTSFRDPVEFLIP